MPIGIKKNVSLKKYTTFDIGGPARYFLEAENNAQIIRAVQWADDNGLPFFILAGGSNLLVSDKGFNGLVIKILISRLESRSETAKFKVISAGAGVKLSDLVTLSLEEGLSGLEWAAGIPQATVGGAIWGNAGAFGKTIGEIIDKVEFIKFTSAKREPEVYENEECGFGYKDSIFKKDKSLIILSADLVLEKKSREEVHKEIKRILKYRKDNHPAEPSAGSVFKNIKTGGGLEKLFSEYPESAIFKEKNEIPAGWLIEKCGLNGKIIGGARISPKHSNFIVNTGSARAADVAALIDLARERVKRNFTVVLREEIQYLGF
ncbi:MAG: UDP-N-acetylmuramate dehydrogenase [Candidatus Pacebacteria bacterium]|nr:UDP-N-acetylmuramate dehydrogenase [Candidatus Paceibacterota bacterium]